MTAPRAHRVSALVLDRVGWLDLAAPTHLFGYCGPPYYEFTLATEVPGPVRTSAGPDVVIAKGLDGLVDADTIVVPGCEDEMAPVSEAVCDALRACAAANIRIMSICTGAFILAAAGLLDGRRATTHWASAALLSQLYPRVLVDSRSLYIDEGQVLTSAGVAAGLDLCLHVIRRDQGSAIAAQFARRTVIAPHREGDQAQYVQRPMPVDAGNTLRAVQDWALAHLDAALPVARLAEHAHMSRRHFLRRFQAETGVSPAHWLLQERLNTARELLETTGLSVEQIATRVGIGSADSLRTHFRAALRTTPTAYRRAFHRDIAGSNPAVTTT